MRTVAVLIGGIALSFLIPTILFSIIFSNEPQLMNRALSAQPNSPLQVQAWQEFQHAMTINAYVIDPIVGVTIGVFVGFLQKKYAALIAVICFIPDWIEGFMADHARIWTHSLRGVEHYLMTAGLPILLAAICSWVLSSKQSNTALKIKTA